MHRIGGLIKSALNELFLDNIVRQLPQKLSILRESSEKRVVSVVFTLSLIPMHIRLCYSLLPLDVENSVIYTTFYTSV